MRPSFVFLLICAALSCSAAFTTPPVLRPATWGAAVTQHATKVSPRLLSARVMMCEGDKGKAPQKRTSGFATVAQTIQKEWEENPQQTLIKLFFFPLSPLFFPVPLTVIYKVYQYATGNGEP